MLCGYPSSIYDDALTGWRRVTTEARDQKRQAREEVLWLNPNAAAALDRASRQPDLFAAL